MAVLLALFCLTSALALDTTVIRCHFNGKTYSFNEQFHPVPCQLCICTKFSSVACSSIDCPPLTCVDSVQEQDKCCPTCPNGSNCMYGNILLKHGELHPLPNGDICECPLVDAHVMHGNFTQAICGKP